MKTKEKQQFGVKIQLLRKVGEKPSVIVGTLTIDENESKYTEGELIRALVSIELAANNFNEYPMRVHISEKH
jgi:hypothetical protein